MFLGDTACFLMYDTLIMLNEFLVRIVSSNISLVPSIFYSSCSWAFPSVKGLIFAFYVSID